MNTEKIVIPDRDRDKSYVGKFLEVIDQVKMTTSDGSTVVIDLENIGQIQVKPWTSEDEPNTSGEPRIVSTYEDRTIFNPCNLHDVEVLELMAIHARRFKEIVDAELAEQESKNPAQSTVTDGKPHSDHGTPSQPSFRLVQA